tara:strand:+ start:4680 stop:5018 length:339 start_codon:yes stop_codon:yes gene_type:complete
MLALASILTSFAAITCFYFQADERGKGGRFPQSAKARKALRLAAIAGLVASLILAVAAHDWAGGTGLWLVAIMVSGVAVVSLAGNHPTLTQRLGAGSAVGGAAVVLVHWVSS